MIQIVFTFILLTLATCEPTPPERTVVYRHAGCDVSTGAYVAYLRGSLE